MFIRCAQVDRHGQLHGRDLQHADDLVLDAVGGKVNGRLLAGFQAGQIVLFLRIKLAVICL